MVIDASGNSKLFQTIRKYDIRTCQYTIICDDITILDECRIDNIKITPGKTMVGYTWVYPTGENKYHVGCCYYREDGELRRYLWNYIKSVFKGNSIEYCNCLSWKNGNLIRESFIGEHYFKGSIVGVGESIGLTDPFGYGNVYAITSAYILSKFIKKYPVDEAIEKYKKYVIKEYGVLDDEKRAIKTFNLPKIVKIFKNRFNISTFDTLKVVAKTFIEIG